MIKGSITIHGVSLTVAAQNSQQILISVIPYTLENTNLQYLKKGSQVNIEVDILGKYVEKWIKRQHNQGGIDEIKLRSLGY